jgi:hemolysin III
MATEEEYRLYRKNLKTHAAALKDTAFSKYQAESAEDEAAARSLRAKEKARRAEYRQEKHSIDAQLKTQLKEAEQKQKAGQELPEVSFQKEKSLSAEEAWEKMNKEPSAPDYTTALSDEEMASLRKANKLPSYTRGEEIFNSVTHIVGGGLGVIGLIVGVIFAAILAPSHPAETWAMAIFGLAMVTLYTMSAIYHGLHINKAKKVFQIIDHCTIYFLISGTYTPICLICLTSIAPWNYVLMAIVYLLDALGIVLNATMMDKFPVKVISNILYLLTGWIVVFFYPVLINSIGMTGIWLLIGGGIAYTVGSIFYAIGHNVKYFHSIFHLFVILGTVLQYLAILLYGVIGLH